MGNSRRHKKQERRVETSVAAVRHERLERLIREELNSLFDTEMQNPIFENLRITRVELARDGSRARLWYGQRRAALSDAAAPFDTRTAAALARATGFLRARLCEALDLKRVPDLRFASDPAFYAEL
jgi:ribosome-binding factor A